MATACVKLIESGDELLELLINDNNPVKIAVKDGDKYTVKDSNDMNRADFEENHLFVEINAATPAAGEQPVDSNATPAATPADGEQPVDSNATTPAATPADGEQPVDSNATPAATPADGEQPVDSNATPADGQGDGGQAQMLTDKQLKPQPANGGKRRKTSKKGHKSTRKGRKSVKKGGKTRKKGRRGKGSRRSKK